MVPSDFQRARHPEQKEQRRATILRVARQMLDESGLEGLTLSALARRVGLAKSNVYRYFESREAILLEVFRADFDDWAEELSTRLRGLRSKRRARRLVELMASTYAARERLCKLMSILPSVIEHNVSVDTIREANAQLIERTQRLAEVMHHVVPELSIEAHVELVRYSYVLVVGLWPITHPLPVVQQLADDPLFAIHRRDFEADLANGMGLVADGMLRQSERGASPSKLER
ncbi:MAG: TetR family transcriptional regulator [Myxococcales bacterium]|nr:TetR family transcriptional regulator [Myxococcales bacterium]